MIPLDKVTIQPESKIIDAVKTIDTNGIQIALVVDAQMKLLGTVTDGDIRRGLLRGVSMQTPVAEIMNRKPITAQKNASANQILRLMKSKMLSQIPVVDENGILKRIEVLGEFLAQTEKENVVVLMAGGMGKRLSPLTDDLPKPLLKVGDKPILEIIIDNFIAHGFSNFFISVNYKADLIKDYFKDGSQFNTRIQYLEEGESLGTAGALSLLQTKTTKPVVIMNGDVLTKVNLSNLLDFHLQQNADATMCVREYDLQVPYGVVDLQNDKIQAIHEKPSQKFFVNAGIYVLNPNVLELIPKNQPFDMPSLFQKLLETKKKPVAFPIREYWLDIGQKGDFEKANLDFFKLFKEEN